MGHTRIYHAMTGMGFIPNKAFPPYHTTHHSLTILNIGTDSVTFQDGIRAYHRMRAWQYRGTSPIRNIAPLGPYRRTMHWALWKPLGGGLFLMSEVPLYAAGLRMA